MAKIDRNFFFREARERPFGGRMQDRHVNGCTVILDRWEKDYADKDSRWLAYCLGTAYHETAHRMEAIHEYGGADYFNRRYGPQTAVGQRLGNTEEGDGDRFHGRGFVQLTGRANYRDWKRRLGVDIVKNPDLVLDAKVAARILIEGSVRGTFTGVKLSNYFSTTRDDWRRARQIINGLDRADHIAELSKQFWAAISYKGSGQVDQAKHRSIVRKGARGEDVRFLQRYLGLVPDGDFGPMTEDVVIAFQSARGLTADGIVGRKTWEVLLTEQVDVRDSDSDVNPPSGGDPAPETKSKDRPLIRFGSRGEHVEELQGLLGITKDGDFGPRTLEKVKEFQRSKGLQDDGVVGPNTWKHLLKA